MNVAIIPARGGSKRIPRKNIRDFCGKPMIAWSIEAARASGCFERIVVSTDDEEIAAVARGSGAQTPFVRPTSLASDHATTGEVMAHAMAVLALEPSTPVCCLYPTSPFLAPADLRAGLEALECSDADFAFSIARFEAPVQRALRRDPGGRVHMLQPGLASTRSQDLEPAFYDAGKFYWGRAGRWASGIPVLAASSIGIELPRERAQDIDTPEDWEWCERLFVACRQEAS